MSEGIRRHDGLIWDRQGAVAVIAGLSAIVVAGFGALALDASYLYQMRGRLQATADAVALAGASQLPDPSDARAAALDYAEKNMAPSSNGMVLDARELECGDEDDCGDVLVGNWAKATRSFTPAGNPTNAVKVTLRRAAANGNAVPLFLAPILGFNEADVTVEAVAWGTAGTPEDCESNGMVAANRIEMGSNEFFDGYCLYGRNGVKFGSNNTFTAGSEIGMLDDSMLQEGSNNDGVAEALVEKDSQPSQALTVASIIDGLIDGSIELPDYITHGIQHVSDLPAYPVSGTAYVVQNKVQFGSSENLSNLVIVTNDELQMGSNYSLKNVIFAARKRIQVGSNGTMGQSDYCTNGGNTVQLLAQENVLIGSNTDFHGVQIIAGQMADMGSNENSGAGLAVQAGTDIKLGSNENVARCPITEHARFTSSAVKLVLVE